MDRLVENAGDAIFIVGKTQTITFWNKAAEELLQYSADEIVGANVDRLSPYENKRQMRSMVVEVFEGGTLKNLECELVRKDGRVVSTYLTASPVTDANENVVGVSVIAMDVTDQNKLVLSLIGKVERTAHTAALMESLTTISHHIRNAAASIQARAELSRQQNTVEHYKQLTDTCIHECRRIVAVIESLNDMVREVSKEDRDLERVDMSGAPTALFDIENRIQHWLKKLDGQQSA